MKTVERRTFDFESRAGEGESRTITGYGAVFDSLSQNLGGFREIIAPGAFDNVLDNDTRALFNHDSNLILGRSTANTLALTVDNMGLRYNVDMPDTTYANDLMVSMKRGDVTQSSFGFVVETDSWAEDDNGAPVRTIRSVSRLLDVSPVTYPAYPDTQVAVRSMENYTSTLANKITLDAEQRDRELQIIKVK